MSVDDEESNQDVWEFTTDEDEVNKVCTHSELVNKSLTLFSEQT